jgi:pimeloyl-ACP methyl ester carboxylesterase
MHRFASYDGTELVCSVLGDGPPLVCLPGGPGRSVDYLGNLGGLDRSRRLLLLDPRGVGLSADPSDPATFSVERLVNDVEALRVHLGLERMDLLAHSAGAVLGTLYAATYPEHLSSLTLVTPGLAAVDVYGTEDELGAALGRSASEPWYRPARAALEEILGGNLTMESFRASRPFYYGRWDETAQAHAIVGIVDRHMAARNGYFADVDFDPSAIRIALAKLSAPVLLYAGDLDPMVTPAMVWEAAPLFNDATVIVQQGAAHFPWVDGPAAFAAAVGSFLADR